MAGGQLKEVVERAHRESNISFDSTYSAPYPQTALLVLASVSLMLGLSVYVFGREVDSTRFLPAVLHLGIPWLEQFRTFTANLPSLFHVYAFILYSAAIVHPGRRHLVLICIAWFSLELVFELLQLFLFNPGPLSAVLGVGVYDPMDIFALILGTVAAYLSVSIIARRRS